IRRCTAVSDDVTRALAFHVLQRTPEATIAAAVTGHFGPEAPPDRDGQIFIAIARRATMHATLDMVLAESARLESSDRVSRQEEAVGKVLSCVRRLLIQPGVSGR
ncbi:MAG: CinA family protein, partial [Planctomycetes bacterium]|nr:CinA family protein [Planctomycetota bacterium]